MAENYFSLVQDGGSINISEEVIISIVRNIVDENEDASLANTVGSELAELLSIRTATKGVVVRFAEDAVRIDVVLTVVYGKNIVETAKQIQENILTELSTIPECKPEVNIHVSGISFNSKKNK